MELNLPTTYGEPLYPVEFRPNGYHIDGKRVKRVTTILDKFPDSGGGLLKWTAKRVAVTAGRLLRDRVVDGNCHFPETEIEMIVQTAHKNPDDIKDETAELGTAVHAFIEEWLKGGATLESQRELCTKYLLPPDQTFLELLQAKTQTGEMSDTDRNLFYDKMKSYMFNRFCAFWLKSGLTYVASEIAVGSRKYKFGGRIDILAADKKGRFVLVDFKTSKWVSPSMFSQVASYKKAYEEQYAKKIFKCLIVQCPREWTEQNQGFSVYNVKPQRYWKIFEFILKFWGDTELKAALEVRSDSIK